MTLHIAIIQVGALEYYLHLTDLHVKTWTPGGTVSEVILLTMYGPLADERMYLECWQATGMDNTG